MVKDKTSLSDVVNIIYANSKNSEFSTKNGFLKLKITVPKSEETVEDKKEENIKETDEVKNEKKEVNDKEADEIKNEKKDEKKEEKPDYDKVITTDNNDGTETREYNRVFLHRAFPFENPDEYISVVDKNGAEVALIRNISDISEFDKNFVIEELKRKYYTPVIKKIISMKERYGFSYWKVETETGVRSFTMQDVYRNVHKVDLNHVFLTDVDGNRYDIEDVESLDKKSYKKIELYL